MNRWLALLLMSSVAIAQPQIGACNAFRLALQHASSLSVLGPAIQECRSSNQEDAVIAYDLALVLEAEGKWKDATEEMRRAMHLSPAFNESNKAELAFMEAQAGKPATEKERLFHQSIAAFSLGRLSDAKVLATNAEQASSGYESTVLLGSIALAQNQHFLAIQILTKAMGEAPDRQKPAVQKLQQLAAKEEQVERLSLMAGSALNGGNPEMAGDLYASAFALKADADMRWDLGFASAMCYLTSTRSAKALPILSQLSQSENRDVADRAQKLRSAVVKQLDQRAKLREKAEQMTHGLLIHYKQPGDLTDLSAKKLAMLEQDLQDVVKEDPSYPQAHHLLAFCYWREKKYELAVIEYRQVIALNPNAKVWYWLARALYNERHYDEARTALQNEIQNPSSVSNEMRINLANDLKGKQ